MNGRFRVRRDRGSVALLVALTGVILLGFSALVVDGGLLYLNRHQLQNAADAAALAGAYELVANPGGAIGVASDYTARNGVAASEVQNIRTTATFNANDSVEVVLNRRVGLLFAPVLNRQSSTVGARALAVVTNIKPYKIWPWGLPKDYFDPNNPNPVSLKVGARNSQIGNFMAVRFPDYSGAKDYEYFIKYGYNDTVPVEIPPGTWTISTETGNVTGPTGQGVSYLMSQPACSGPPVHIDDCATYGLVPILNEGTWGEVRGHDQVTIKGFAIFHLLGVQDAKDVGEGTGQKEVVGVWVKDLVIGAHPPTRLGQALDGLVGIRLWR